MPENILAKARNILAQCNGDRDAAMKYVEDRPKDKDLFETNEQARVLGWQQAFRTVSTSDRHSAPGSSEKYVGGGGRVTGAANFRPSSPPPRSSEPPYVDPTTAKAKRMADDFATQYVKNSTLFGGNVTLANATRPDYDRSINSYVGQRDAANKMAQYHAACRDMLPKGSLTDKHTPEQYQAIYELAIKHEVIRV